MSKVKIRLFTLVALVVLFAASLGLALFTAAVRADAVTYSVNTVFSEGTGGTISASTPSEAGGDSYMRFTQRDGGVVYYRRDLALKWYAAVPKAAEAEPHALADLTNPSVTHYFSMTFAFAPAAYTTRTEADKTLKVCPRCGFGGLSGETLEADAAVCSECGFSFADTLLFKEYEILFESAEENVSKDGKAVNSLRFKEGTDGKLTVAVVDASHREAEDSDLTYKELGDIAYNGGDIRIDFSETDEEDAVAAPGEFVVYATFNSIRTQLGKFTNIGSYFMEYRSSGDTPNTPITFKATLEELPEGHETWNKVSQIVHMKALNGQSFTLTSEGKVEDNAPAVLVLDEKVYPYTLGKRFSLTYEAIDVCDDSVTVTRSYYMLAADKHKPNEENDDDYSQLTTSVFFMPSSDSDSTTQYVSIRFRLDDGRGADLREYVYLTWYAAEDAVSVQGEGDQAFDYILVDREQDGPSYTDITFEGEENRVPDTTAREKYQEAVTAAAEKTSAGEGAYIYLPSLRGLIGSDDADYRNLRFTISYYRPGQAEDATPNNETSLRYNALRFPISQKGKYVFKVIASDANGEPMRMYLDGNLVNVTTSNAWDIDAIPTFTFEAKYTGATIEETKSQAVGYLDSVYTVSSFDVIALAGYSSEYTLYRFDASKLGERELPSYEACVSNAAQYAENDYKDCLVEIDPYNDDITEDDPAWDRTDNAYEWDPDASTKTFRPQVSTYYFVKLEVTDAEFEGFTATAYQVIDVQNPRDTVVGRSDWLENNVTAVVLFSISAVLAIAIVVLFVVKPSDKKVEEVDVKSLKGNKKK